VFVNVKADLGLTVTSLNSIEPAYRENRDFIEVARLAQAALGNTAVEDLSNEDAWSVNDVGESVNTHQALTVNTPFAVDAVGRAA
jgi:hypothetical protein